LKKLSLLLVFLLSSSLYVDSHAGMKDKIAHSKKGITCPKKFLDNPPVYFYCIYLDYHNRKFDNGIEKAKEALREIEPLYRKNPEAKVPNARVGNARLKDDKVYKVKSDLHMLLGMLYFKKAMDLRSSEERKKFMEFENKLENKGLNYFEIDELMNLYTMKKIFPEAFNKKREEAYNKLLKKAGISEKELDRLYEEMRKEEEKVEEERYSFISKAVKEFQTAVKVDPDNADAYYQMGNLLSGISEESAGEDSEAAEEAYYKAALIFKKKGDKEAFKEVLRKLQMLNPKSPYLKKLKGDHA
jgi:tetratricopeptide (TPR) repeat protein